MENIPFLAESFGQALRSYRQQARLTQQELATRIGSVTSYIRFLEYGQKIPTLNTFHLLCEALHVLPHEFMAEYQRILVQMQDRS